MKCIANIEIKNPSPKLLDWIEKQEKERELRLKRMTEEYETFKANHKESEKEN